MSNYTTHFQLNYLNQNQIAKDIVINQSIQTIDNIIKIKAINLTNPPPSNPSEGDTYIVNTGGTGAWSGFDYNIAIFQNKAWFFIPPIANSICYILYLYANFFYDGYRWRIADSAPKIGDYKISAQKTDHDNWMLCDGRAIKMTKYNQLFGLLSTKFGTGDGSTTFNIPKISINNIFQNTIESII